MTDTPMADATADVALSLAHIRTALEILAQARTMVEGLGGAAEGERRLIVMGCDRLTHASDMLGHSPANLRMAVNVLDEAKTAASAAARLLGIEGLRDAWTHAVLAVVAIEQAAVAAAPHRAIHLT